MRSRKIGAGRLKISAMMRRHSSSVMERNRAPRSSSSALPAMRHASTWRTMSFFSRSSMTNYTPPAAYFFLKSPAFTTVIFAGSRYFLNAALTSAALSAITFPSNCLLQVKSRPK